jgi:hypothetical protein
MEENIKPELIAVPGQPGVKMETPVKSSPYSQFPAEV